ncbi:MAG: hypothetical protein P4M11_08895 [Candidatus Pacebacteria bacterium]|nr:hypothetical protein [Candidatus Paceibacterota bacterium]
MYLALHNSFNKSKEEKGKLISVEEYIIRADGFEAKLMKQFVDSLRIEVRKMNEKPFLIVAGIVAALDSYIEKNCTPVYDLV